MHVISQGKKRKRIMLSYDQPAAVIWVSYLSIKINAIFPICTGHKSSNKNF